ncbi:nuclear transport factor 2 family protein [Sphingomonas sp.]|uniref:YybH family protein n=1 Tax=Sphingomonas sp. TaxID=28214 RepID=UPI00286BFD65|nr:nuclear transport factor 2 family protein [Sphingomonas sp.]
MAKLLSIITLIALASTPAVAGPAATWGHDIAAVRAVLGSYEAAVQRLDARGTEVLFADDSEIFESGGSEGNYANYLVHHLTPELSEFKSFKFSDYKVSVRFSGPVALAAETYKYRIELKSGEVAERFGVATSVLRKKGSRWQIISMHSSARKPKTP